MTLLNAAPSLPQAIMNPTTSCLSAVLTISFEYKSRQKSHKTELILAASDQTITHSKSKLATEQKNPHKIYVQIITFLLPIRVFSHRKLHKMIKGTSTATDKQIFLEMTVKD